MTSIWDSFLKVFQEDKPKEYICYLCIHHSYLALEIFFSYSISHEILSALHIPYNIPHIVALVKNG